MKTRKTQDFLRKKKQASRKKSLLKQVFIFKEAFYIILFFILDFQSKSINKNKRQSDLKGVLLETMMLTNILKEQLQVLKNKGINGTYQSSPYGKKISNLNQSQQGNN